MTDEKQDLEGSEEFDDSSWSGFDAMLCWIGVGVCLFLLMLGCGSYSKLESEGYAERDRARCEEKAK